MFLAVAEAAGLGVALRTRAVGGQHCAAVRWKRGRAHSPGGRLSLYLFLNSLPELSFFLALPAFLPFLCTWTLLDILIQNITFYLTILLVTVLSLFQPRYISKFPISDSSDLNTCVFLCLIDCHGYSLSCLYTVWWFGSGVFSLLVSWAY